ncbi:hypothetical protein Vafri_14453, partial [Volvox africanus]
MEAPYPAQLVGWVVWGKVKSLPWWPGQVMHPSKGPPEVRKMAAMKSNTGKLLVMFLGDNKYAFLPWESVVDFAENKERHSSTNYASKYWKLGLEEAEELLARRAGLLPATDHEPVDFATKKTNFTSLAKAWAGGLGSNAKQQNNSGASGGRVTERSKASPLQPETSKIIASSLSSPDAKTFVPAPKVHHRSGGASTDDGRPKSIGGVMLEWARYMPQVTATRKGAELSSAAEILRFVRRLARGEEAIGDVAAANEHALQMLHSFTLQRRLREVDGFVRQVTTAAAAAAAAAATKATTTTLDCIRPGYDCIPPPPRVGTGDAGSIRGGAGGEESAKDDAVRLAGGPLPLPPLTESAGQGDAGPVGPLVPVVVQEMFTINNAAAVPVPARVLEALLKGGSDAHEGGGVEAAAAPRGGATASAGGGGSHNQAFLGAEAEAPKAEATTAEAEAAAGGTAPTVSGASPIGGALTPLPGTGGAERAKAEDPQGATTALRSSLVVEAAADGGQQQQQRQQQVTSSVAAGAAVREVAMEVDVVLRVNGKLLPHLSFGLMMRRTTPSKNIGEAQEARPGAVQQQPQQPPVSASRWGHQGQQALSQPQVEGKAAAAAAAAAAATAELPEVAPAEGANAGTPPPATAAAAAAAGSIEDSVDRMETAAAAAAAAPPAAAAVLPPDTPSGLHQPQEEQHQQEQEQREVKTMEGASAGGTGVEESVPVSKAAATALSADASASAAQAATQKPMSAPPPGTASPKPRVAPAAPPPPARGKTASGSSVVAANICGGAAAAKGDPPETASLDLSICLAPWLRGEVRVTSWTVCGPRLILIAVSADRKRDGGLGGIKREARLLLAEAKERRAASPGGPDDDVVDNTGGEQQLKRRLRSATSPPAPAAASAASQAHGSAGGT